MKVMVSGGFDPLHIGHVRLIRESASMGDVIVSLNSDDWLRRKKGYVFMPWRERAEILYAIQGVKLVHAVDDWDGSVAEAITSLRPDIFANGGDRKQPNSLEHDACQKVGCKELFGVGGEKVQSSSRLVDANLRVAYG